MAIREKQVFQAPCSALGVGEHFIAFPLREGYSGAQRLEEITSILGEVPAELLERFGTYELSEDITRSLRLQGISLPVTGECDFLSPLKWETPPKLLFTVLDIQDYLSQQEYKNIELLVPVWATPFQKRVPESEWLSMYAQMLSPICPYLHFRVEK